MKCDEHLGFSAPTGSFVALLCNICFRLPCSSGTQRGWKSSQLCFFLPLLICFYPYQANKCWSNLQIKQNNAGSRRAPLKTKSNCFCSHIPPHAAHESVGPWCVVLVFLHFTVCLWTHKAESHYNPPTPTNPQKSCSVAMTTEIKAIKDDLSRKGRSKFAHSPLSSARHSCDPLSTLISLYVIPFNKTKVLTNDQV